MKSTLKEFGDYHDLELEVGFRGLDEKPATRYYTSFSGVDELEGSFLIGTYGNGSSPEAAMEDYLKQISGKTLKIDAYSDESRIIHVWELEGVE